VAYEQLSGRAVFIWGDATATDNYYRIWNGAALTANTLLDIPAMGNDGDWVRLVSRPDSNQLMYGVKDQNQDLNTALWSGPPGDSWTVHAEHDASTEDTGSRNFDIVFESHPANADLAWLVWGNGITVSRRQWNSSTSTWGAITTVGDDTALIQLMADPTTGVVFSGLYEDSTSATDDIWEMRLTGGGAVWSAKFTVWGGATVVDPVMERIFLAAGRGNALTVLDRQEIYP
jgi:hypothetical protein